MKEKLIEKYSMKRTEKDNMFNWYEFNTGQVTNAMLQELMKEATWINILPWDNWKVHVIVEFLPF